MVSAVIFSINGFKHLSIGAWNINGRKNKLDRILVRNWIYKNEINFFCKSMSTLNIQVPGYETIHGNYTHTTHNRGGTFLLVKKCLEKFMFDVDISTSDQIWFRFRFMPDVLFGACYIVPNDSPYYSDVFFANVARKCSINPKCILFGDFNARMSDMLKKLVQSYSHLSYDNIIMI